MKRTHALTAGLIATFLTSSASADPAPAVSARIENGAAVLLRGDSRTVVVPSGAEVVHLAGGRLYVAVGRGVVRVYDVSPTGSATLLGHAQDVGGKVTGFHELGGETWMEIQTRQALPVLVTDAPATPLPIPSPEPAAGAAASPPAATSPAAPAEVTVTSVSPGEIRINAGKAEGFAVGDRVSLYRTKPTVPGSDDFVNRERVAIVEIVAVKAHSALCERSRGQHVAVGDTVERAKPDEHDSLIYPRRLERLVDFSVTVRPLIKVGTPLGGGALIDGAATYLGKGYFAGARVHPLGVGFTKEGNVVSSSLMAEAGYDARPFAVGLGFGFSAVNGDLDYMLNSTDYSVSADGGVPSAPSWSQRTQTAFALGQVVRLGARDGLNFSLVNVLLFHRNSQTGANAESGFIYGATTAKLTIPLVESTDLFAEGGGGFMGYAYGALGVQTWLVGRGDAGSIGLSVAAGGAAVWGSREVTETFDGGTPNNPSDDTTYQRRDSVSIGGPMASIGFQYRMGL